MSENIGVKIEFDDSAFIQGVPRVVDGFGKMGRAEEAFYSGSQKAMKERTTLSESLNEHNKKSIENLQKYARELENSELALKNSAKELTIYGVNLGSVSKRYESYKSNLKDAVNLTKAKAKSLFSINKLSDTQTKSIDRLNKIFKINRTALTGLAHGSNLFVKSLSLMKSAIHATGIGALAIGLASVVAFFARTKKGADLFNRGLAILGATTSVITDRFAAVGESIFNAFNNPKQAVIDLWEIVKTNIINRFKAVPLLFKAVGKSIEAALTFDTEKQKEALGEFGTALTQITTGLDENQQTNVFDSVVDTLKEIKEESKVMDDLTVSSQNLRDRQNELTVSMAKTRAEIKKYNLIAEDTTKTFNERFEAAQKEGELERKLLQERLSLQGALVTNLKARQALGNNLASDEEELANAQASYFAIVEESTEKQISQQNRLNALKKEEAQRLEDLSDRFADLQNDLIDKTVSIEIELEDNPIGKLKKQQEVALTTMRELSKASLKEAKEVLDAGLITQEQYDAAATSYERLATLVSSQYQEEIQKAIDEGNRASIARFIKNQEKLQSFLSKGIDDHEKIALARLEVDEKYSLSSVRLEKEKEKEKLQIALEAAEKRLQLIAQTEGVESNSYELLSLQIQKLKNDISGIGTEIENLDSIGSKLQTIFNSEEFKAAEKAFGSLVDAFTAGTQHQIDELERLSEKRQDVISDLEDDVEKQKELADLGLANDLETATLKLEAEKVEEEERQNQIIALKKKQIKTQLALDLASQASATGVAVANYFAAHSQIPFVGVALAIGAIATMFATIKAAKAETAALTSLSTGTGQISESFGHVGPKTDRGASPGYAIIDAATGQDTRVRIGGDEALMKQSISARNRTFLEDWNKNPEKYKHLNFNSLVSDPSAFLQSRTIDLSQAAEAASSGVVQYRDRVIHAGRGSKVEGILESVDQGIKKVANNTKPKEQIIAGPNGYLKVSKDGRSYTFIRSKKENISLTR